MIQSYKTTISRKKLKLGEHLPEKQTIIREEAVDTDSHYYSPAVLLLGKMFQDLKR